MRNTASEWQVYRTRFLIRAKQLSGPLSFVDSLGREHHGQMGDYLVETSDGLRRIAPREIFEDVYIAMGPARSQWLSVADHDSPNHDSANYDSAAPQTERRSSPRVHSSSITSDRGALCKTHH